MCPCTCFLSFYQNYFIYLSDMWMLLKNVEKLCVNEFRIQSSAWTIILFIIIEIIFEFHNERSFFVWLWNSIANVFFLFFLYQKKTKLTNKTRNLCVGTFFYLCQYIQWLKLLSSFLFVYIATKIASQSRVWKEIVRVKSIKVC